MKEQEEEAERIIKMYAKTFREQGAKHYVDSTKECALIHVQGIIQSFINPKNVSYKQSVEKIEAIKDINRINVEYWQQVKTILENK